MSAPLVKYDFIDYPHVKRVLDASQNGRYVLASDVDAHDAQQRAELTRYREREPQWQEEVRQAKQQLAAVTKERDEWKLRNSSMDEENELRAKLAQAQARVGELEYELHERKKDCNEHSQDFARLSKKQLQQAARVTRLEAALNAIRRKSYEPDPERPALSTRAEIQLLAEAVIREEGEHG